MTSISRGRIGLWVERVLSPNAFELALRFTLLGLLLQPVGSESIRPWILCIAVVGLIVPSLTRRVELWGTLAVLTGLRVVLDWPLGDNHAYLLFYWCLAVAISLCAEDAPVSLARQGRWLIGLVFAFAVIWKAVLSTDFVDGTFFRVMLLTDPRFEDFVRLATSLTHDQIELQREALVRHADGGMLPMLAESRLPESFDGLARFMTGWTLFIEGLVAVLFLWPRRHASWAIRDVALLAFCASTYAVATVAGFGWLVIAMGIAQCDTERKHIRACYVACFALILFYREVPWARLLADWLVLA
jgi:hypothetical protein